MVIAGRKSTSLSRPLLAAPLVRLTPTSNARRLHSLRLPPRLSFSFTMAFAILLATTPTATSIAISLATAIAVFLLQSARAALLQLMPLLP